MMMMMMMMMMMVTNNGQKEMNENANQTSGKGRVNGKDMLYPADIFSAKTMSAPKVSGVDWMV